MPRQGIYYGVFDEVNACQERLQVAVATVASEAYAWIGYFIKDTVWYGFMFMASGHLWMLTIRMMTHLIIELKI
jgi:hypothetical protein